jgi:uncharacterized protein YkwD
MLRRALFLLGVSLLVVYAVLGSASTSYAESPGQPSGAGSPYEVVNAVNALRASFGLSPYRISPILMSTAQAQADFLAATGSMTHSGPGGMGLTERLLAAGYPLAGDLSLGGFRSENITGGVESIPAEAAVDQWTSDTVHLETMVSQSLTEIGAGVAVSGGRVYYVIDCARATTSGDLSSLATSVSGGSPVPEISPVIVPVSVSTPNLEGKVVHEVRPGQTLWQIAMTYEVKIDDIKRLNNLFDNNIYPGNQLLIKQEVSVQAVSPTETQLSAATTTSLPAPTVTTPDVVMSPTIRLISPSSTRNNSALGKVMMAIILLAILGGVFFTWLGSSRKH